MVREGKNRSSRKGQHVAEVPAAQDGSPRALTLICLVGLLVTNNLPRVHCNDMQRCFIFERDVGQHDSARDWLAEMPRGSSHGQSWCAARKRFKAHAAAHSACACEESIRPYPGMPGCVGS